MTMTMCIQASLLLMLTLLTVPVQAEETPDMDLLFFLAEFTDDELTDELGNWSAADIENESDSSNTVETEQ